MLCSMEDSDDRVADIELARIALQRDRAGRKGSGGLRPISQAVDRIITKLKSDRAHSITSAGVIEGAGPAGIASRRLRR